MPTFGDLTAGGDTFPCSDGRALVDRYTLTEAATVTGIFVNFSSGTTAGTSFKGIILADSAGLPGSVLVVGAATAIPAGGGYIQSTASGSLAAGDYWIGYVANNFTASSTQDASGAAPNMQMANGTFSYATPPASWPGSSANYGGGLNAYVEYTAAGGGAYTITAESGSFAESGAAASLEFGRVMPANGGSYALTGTSAGTLAGRRVAADTGSVALSGADAAAELGRLLGADVGAYALTGTDAALSRTFAGAYALSAETGAFALSGGEATLTAPTVALGGSHDAALAEWEARRRSSRLPSLEPERVEPAGEAGSDGGAAGSAVAPQPGMPLGTLADALLRAGVPQAVAKRGEYVVERGPKARIRVPAPVPARIEDEEAVAMLLLLMEAA